MRGAQYIAAPLIDGVFGTWPVNIGIVAGRKRKKMTITTEQIKEANILYHDAAASEYDAKWGIDFGVLGKGQVLGKVEKALGKNPGPFARGLEIGSGTGYFSLNMMLTGVLDSVVCTDISPGMLQTLSESADLLGVGDRVETLCTEAEAMPLEDESFDLIFGHAVVHHLPDLAASFAEFYRLLKPGGMLMFCGEPSYRGDRLARFPKQAASIMSPLWRRALRVRPAEYHHEHDEGHAMEPFVDVHAFVPSDLADCAREADLENVRVIGEELTANWFGWANRTLEASGRQEDIPNLWRQYAYHGYLNLQKLDRKLLEGRLPASIFYNLILAARKPA